MNHKDISRDGVVLASIKRIRIADNIFGYKSRTKLQDIINQEDIWWYFEEIPKSLHKLQKGEKTSYSPKEIQDLIMDEIILSILKEAITQAVKAGIGQLTDELVAEAIDRRVVWSAIVQKESSMKRMVASGREI